MKNDIGWSDQPGDNHDYNRRCINKLNWTEYQQLFCFAGS